MDGSQWHLDKRVPVAIIVTLFAQFIGFGWMFGAMENRVTQLERRADLHDAMVRDIPEKIGRLDEQVRGIRQMLDRIDKKLDGK